MFFYSSFAIIFHRYYNVLTCQVGETSPVLKRKKIRWTWDVGRCRKIFQPHECRHSLNLKARLFKLTMPHVADPDPCEKQQIPRWSMGWEYLPSHFTLECGHVSPNVGKNKPYMEHLIWDLLNEKYQIQAWSKLGFGKWIDILDIQKGCSKWVFP